MKNIYIFLIVIILPIIHSCSNEKSKTVNDILVKSKDIEFKRADNTDEYFMTQYVDADTSDLFIALDSDKRVLYVYNVLNGDLINEINIPYNNIIQSFYFKDINNIYFTPRNKFDILNFSSLEKIDTIISLNINNIKEFAKNNTLSSNLEFLPTSISPLYVEDSTFYVLGSLISHVGLKNQSPLYIITKYNGSININGKIGKFPNELIAEGKTLFPFDTTIAFTRNNKKQTIVSFFPDEHIYIYNDSILVSKNKLASEHIKTMPTFIPKNNITYDEASMKRYIEMPSYQGLFYDKYNDLYYRIAKLEQKFKSKDGVINLDYNFSIIVIDNNFNIIKEQIFNTADYLISSIIITKNGIMLKKPDDLSGKSKYGLFKINEQYLKK